MNSTNFVNYTVNTSGGIISSVLSCLSLVFMWKIYSDHGQSGVTSIIPFYRHIVFGRIVHKESEGRKLVALLAGIFIVVFVDILILIAALSYSRNLVFLAIALSIALLVFIVWAFIVNVKLINAFVMMKNAESYWTLIWVLLPFVATGYFAFGRDILKNNNHNNN